MAQFGKFFIVGVLNTAIDLGVLAILTLALGSPISGTEFAFCKIVSFLCALANSYWMNKYWVFKTRVKDTGNSHGEKKRFVSVSMVGLVINTIAASIAFRIGSSAIPDMQALAVQLGGLVGTAAALAWNFVGYKFIVFKKNNYEKHTSFSNSSGIQGIKENRNNTPQS